MPARVRPTLTASLAGALAFLLLIGVLLGAGVPAARADTRPVDPADPATPATVSADGLPTVQINGVVWAQAVAGNTVYVAGKFSTARPAGAPAGTQEVARNNLLAYDIRTGALISSFNPDLNAQALALTVSPDGRRLYVGGDFTRVGTATRNRIAAFDTATGALVSGFAPSVTGQVRTLAATASTVYLGGAVSAVGGTSRSRLAAVTTAGALLPWAPVPGVGPTDGNRFGDARDQQTSNAVRALVVTDGGAQVVAAGHFYTLNGVLSSGVGALDGVTGDTRPFAMGQLITNQGVNSAVYSLSTDGSTVYGTGYDFYGPGNIEGSFAATVDGGRPLWVNDCRGDTYSSVPLGGALYMAGHPHVCSAIGGFDEQDPRVSRYATAVSLAATGSVRSGGWTGRPAPTLQHWYPDFAVGTVTGAYQAGWNVATNGQYLLYGGEFTRVNNVAQQGLVRFPVSTLAPNKVGPNSNDLLTPSVSSPAAGSVRVQWTATSDPDNEQLTYTVTRSDRPTQPVFQGTRASSWYARPAMGVIDRDVTPGTRYTYRVTATDPFGNTATRATASVVASDAALSSYATTVLADGATGYWPLDALAGPTGTTAHDQAGLTDITTQAGLTVAAGSPLEGGSSLAGSGTTTARGTAAASGAAAQAPDVFSLELWFSTTSTTAGRLAGFGNRATTDNSSYDRMLYLDTRGRLVFGVYTGATATVASSAALNDGAWHHAVAELSPAGMVLYVDGLRVGARTDVTAGQSYAGWWQIGGNNTGSWPSAPATRGFTGQLAQAAVYPTALSTAQVRAHVAATGRTVAVPSRPADAYGAAVWDDGASHYWRLDDAAGSARAAGSVGDGLPATYTGAVTQALPGAPMTGVPTPRAIDFAGQGGLATSGLVANPTTFSTEVWFSTTTTRGGRLIGLGTSATGSSSSYDRYVYMLDDGRLRFGVWRGSAVTIDSTTALNDGRWHQVVATFGPAGMALYVDGQLQGTHANTQVNAYDGYWRLGADRTWGGASSDSFTGTLDEASVYPTQLTSAQVRAHYTASGRTPAPGPVVDERPTASFTATAQDLTVSLDASASSDPEGPLAAHRWAFGDGSSAAGATVSHSYAAAGSYPVTLTVTDSAGHTATSTQTVTVAAPPPNRAPTASSTVTAADLTVAVDGRASSDTDGTVTGFAWDFGDGATATGATASHAYTTAGTYTVTLTVTDDDGATGTGTATVTVSPPANGLPSAAFTAGTAGLEVRVDGSSSTDADGRVTGWTWAFGDGATATGPTASHTYAAAGTYRVVLTVTDDRQGTGSAEREVTVTVPPTAGTPVVADRFERTVTTGLGAAETGGPWTVSGGSAVTASVSAGAGLLTVTRPGATVTAALGQVQAQDLALQTTFRLPAATTGGGVYLNLGARRVGNDQYKAVARVYPTGQVNLSLVRTSGGVETTLRGSTVAGLSYAPGTQLTLLLDVSGSGTTALAATVWPSGAARPATPQVTATDTTPGLQGAGGVSLGAYVSGSSTNTPTRVEIDDVWAGPSGSVRPAG